MQKSHFAKTFEITRLFAKSGTICVILGLSLILLDNLIRHHTSHIDSLISLPGYVILIFGLSNLLVTIPLIHNECTERLANDDIKNYVKSVIKTLMLRHYLRQNDVLSVTNNSISRKTVRQFNHWMSYSLVDVRHNQIFIMIVIPPSHQAQQYLQTLLVQIKEEISSSNTDYYISGPLRDHHLYWFVGDRR